MKYLVFIVFFSLFFSSHVYGAGTILPTPSLNPTDAPSSRSFTSSDGVFRTITANGPINSVVETGSTVYVGGNFTEINGQPRKYIAAFDKVTGALTAWRPEINEPVKDIYVDSSSIYFSREKNPDKRLSLNISSYNPQNNTFTYYPRLTITVPSTLTNPPEATTASLIVDKKELGFKIPNFSDILTFTIRAFFVVAGLAALFYLLQGALAWVTSGGDKEKIEQARAKITSTVVGLIIIISVLAVVVTLEQIVFARRLCVGLSCPASIPRLVEPL